MRKSAYLFAVVLLLSVVIGRQVRAQMASSVKYMIEQFGNMKPEAFDEDEVIDDAAPIPMEGRLNDMLYDNALNQTEELFSLVDPQNGYSEIDGKEYPTNSVTLEFSYLSLPCFQCINGWLEEVSVKDAEGKDLLMKEKDVEKYRDLGIIDEGFNYPVPAEYSEVFWLNRELKYQEGIHFSGKIMLDYPDDYEMAVFAKADTVEPRTVGGITYRLVGIDHNIITVLIKGDRRKMEGVKEIVLNKDNMPFGSMNSVSIDAGMYDPEAKKVRELSDKEIEDAVKNFDMSNTMVEQVRKIRVSGNADKLVLMKVNTTKMLEHPFDVTLQAEY